MIARSRTLMVAAAAALAVPLAAQDRALAVPGMKVLLENERVRVQYHDVAVGETVPMHTHPSYVAYVLAPYKARLRAPDGTERLVNRHPGDVFWGEPTTHTVENLGTEPIHNLIVEIKDPNPSAPATPAACAWPPEQDAVAVAPDDHLVALENERVRVLDVTIRPGERTPLHAHCRPGVAFVLWQGRLREHDAEGHLVREVKETPPADRFPEARWMEPQPPHTTRNLDAKPMRLLRIELKR
jgi:quercetin dioxygenase-like cupin family protein